MRIGEILDTTELDEWRWIPGKHNVADEAMKWAKNPDISISSRWFKGPDFLLAPMSEWPNYDTMSDLVVGESVEYIQLHDTSRTIIDVNRFSKWNRLLRTAAYVLRTSLELANAEILLFRLAQSELYGEEINILKANERFVNLAHFIKYLQNWMKINSFAWKDV